MKQAETQKTRRRRRRDGAPAGDLPVAAGAGADDAAGGRRVAGVPAPSGQDALAVRASKKLRSDELLVTGFAATRLRMELDRVPLWRGDHVAVKQLVEDFARYVYLPRLKDPAVLVGAIRDGAGLLTWEEESFRLRRQLRRGGGPLPRIAWRAARLPGRCRLARPAREGQRRPVAARRR